MEQSKDKAVMLLQKAADQGHLEAKATLDQIEVTT